MTQLIVIHNPLDRRARDVHDLSTADPGTVAALVGEYAPAGVNVSVAVNGNTLSKEDWPTYTPRPSDQVVLIPHMAGDGFNPLSAVLMIAMMVYAPQLAFSLYGAGGGTMTAAAFAASSTGMFMTAGIGAQGNMVIARVRP